MQPTRRCAHIHKLLSIRLGLIVAIVLGQLLNSAPPALAAPGDLDPTFGIGGVAITSLNDRDISTYDLAVQSDGKTVVVGDSVQYSDNFVGDSDFAILRYNIDGDLDTTFDGDGMSITDLNNHSNERVTAVAIQSDHKIVVAGVGFSNVNNYFILARYTSDGDLDASFDRDGFAILDLNNSEWGIDVAIQSDGKIVVAGGGNGNFIAARYNADGALDKTWDRDGIVFTDFGIAQGIYGSGLSMILQPDDKVIVAGNTRFCNPYPTHCESDFALVRYDQDGGLDSTFGGDGMVVSDLNPGRQDSATSVALQSDGKLVVGGYIFQDRPNKYIPYAVVVRYDIDGDLDIGFGDFGQIIDYNEMMTSNTIVRVQYDDKIVMSKLLAHDAIFSIRRYDSDGKIDYTFGNGGDGILYDAGFPLFGILTTNIMIDGRIVVFGWYYHKIIALRYIAQNISLIQTVSDASPEPGQMITLTLKLRNNGPVATHTALISDTLPAGLTRAGPITLDPPSSGTIGTSPVLVRDIVLAVGQTLTVTFPVTVSASLPIGTLITNTAASSSAEAPKPVMASVVIALPTPPAAQDDLAIIEKDQLSIIPVLGNDRDVNDDMLTITALGAPHHGSIALDGSTVIYTPTLGFLGTDVFTYTVSDGAFYDSATVQVLVVEKAFKQHLPLLRVSEFIEHHTSTIGGAAASRLPAAARRASVLVSVAVSV
jgi:uncharacterized delta-60 repeat protein/uncharacterized repeat protein (TIGR01451 family)